MQAHEGPSNSAPRQDFLPLKVKEHHLALLLRQVSESIRTPLEGNPRDYGEYKHYTTREKPSISAGLMPTSSAGHRATSKALQLFLSSSACYARWC